MNWDSLAGNPAPGNPASARQIASRFGTVRDEARRIRVKLEAVADDCGPTVWEGLAANTFQDQVKDIVPDLQKLEDSHAIAANAMADYASALEDAQEHAQRALTQADAALADEHTAQSAHDAAESTRAAEQHKADAATYQLNLLKIQMAEATLVGDVARLTTLQHEYQAEKYKHDVAASAAATATNQRDAAQRQVNDAKGRLSAAHSLADDARSLRDSAGKRCSASLHDASEHGITNKHWWAKAFHAAVHAIDQAIDKATASRFFQEFMKTLDELNGILTMAAVLVAFFAPEVAAILFAAATIIGVLVLAMQLVALAEGHTTGSQVFWAALGAIPGARVVKEAVVAEKGLRGLVKLGPVLRKQAEEEVKIVKSFGPEIKRSLKYLDNRHLSGGWLKLLKSTHVAPHAPELHLFSVPESTLFQLRTGVHGLYNVFHVEIIGHSLYHSLTGDESSALPGGIQTDEVGGAWA